MIEIKGKPPIRVALTLLSYFVLIYVLLYAACLGLYYAAKVSDTRILMIIFSTSSFFNHVKILIIMSGILLIVFFVFKFPQSIIISDSHIEITSANVFNQEKKERNAIVKIKFYENVFYVYMDDDWRAYSISSLDFDKKNLQKLREYLEKGNNTISIEKLTYAEYLWIKIVRFFEIP